MQKNSFSLESSIYDSKYIDQAIQDFWDDFSISYKNGTLEIDWETEYEIAEIFREFMNYLIGLHSENA